MSGAMWWLKLVLCVVVYVVLGVALSGSPFARYHAISFYSIGVIAAAK